MSFDLRPILNIRNLMLSGIVMSLMVWLGLSSNPSAQRERRLNELIAAGEIGHTNPNLQKRLEMQFTWLARHAGVKSRIAINEPIHAQQLNLLVTTPKYSDVTHCGTGNAIFDPSLNTIFVDESLLWPTEVNVIGTPSVNTMFSIDDYGYVVSYTNFILAHELGHLQKHDRSSAFFYYGWGDRTANLAQEQEADQSAIKTIFGAREAGDEPLNLKKFDALTPIGLGRAQLTTRESAAADILGGMLLMADDLLFSSSPFSPYYSDRSHPSMLRRADDAIRVIELVPSGPALNAGEGLVQAELKRVTELGNWNHRELFFPGPLLRVDVRSGFLWLGRTDIRSAHRAELEEQIYKVPLPKLAPAETRNRETIIPAPVKTGHSKVGEAHNYAEAYGAWVDEEFEHGDRTIGLPPDEVSRDPQPEKDWGRSRWGGLESLGIAWRWPARDNVPPGKVTERYLLSLLRRLIPGRRTVNLGQVQWQGAALVIPVVIADLKSRTELRLFQLTGSEPFRLVERNEFRLTSLGKIDVAAAKIWNGSLWVPVRIGGGDSNYRVELWKVVPGGTKLFDTVPFLVGQARTDLETEGLGRLVPENPKLLPISDGRAVFGYDHDSLYLVDERADHLKVLFHPAAAGLRLTDLGSGLIMFWKLHARKAYLVSTN